MTRVTILVVLILSFPISLRADAPRALPIGERPQDVRLNPARTLNSYFPFQQVEDAKAWAGRQAEIRRRILVSQGLWPMPTKAALNPIIHGRVDRDDYTVDRVFFESIPGHYVTGSLYRPKGKTGPLPGILCPHGHWRDGRFYAHNDKELRDQLATGAERWEQGGRYPLQARCVQLARMGCIVFLYDMTGYADSIQLQHRPVELEKRTSSTDEGFGSVQAELRLQNMMGLQTWNSIRSLDFLLSLEDIDPQRVGVTGASGGGTQSMLLSAIDERVTASMPCVMVSTSMQGGCTCENAPLLRIVQGNIDIAAATAPRPLGLTAADDWTRELKTKGYPDLLNLYQMLGHPDRLTAAFHIEFQHNYNHVNRAVMYGFFNRHFGLGFEEPVLERDFEPLSREEATVWTAEYPAPSGDRVGPAHEIEILKLATADAEEQISALIPDSKQQLATYRDVVGGAWETILGRKLADVSDVEFHESFSEERDGYTLWTGLVTHAEANEVVPALFLYPATDWNRQVVLWLTDSGKAGIWEKGQPIEPVRKLLEAGYSIAAADLFSQGEFNPEGERSADEQRWTQENGKNSWSPFAGYTFGYNHPLFVQRVHDVLTMLALAQQHESKPEQVHVVGIGQAAGPIALAARSQAPEIRGRTFADCGDFRFGSVKGVDDPMFVPGAVKYLDVDGLLSLCVDGECYVAAAEPFPVSRQVAAMTKGREGRSSTGLNETSSTASLIDQMLERLTND